MRDSVVKGIEKLPARERTGQAQLRGVHQSIYKPEMNHCKTCKFFVGGVYPLNAQLGHCVKLDISRTQPCGVVVSGYPYTPYKKDSQLIYALPRMLDTFGCVYHEPKEITSDTPVKEVRPLLVPRDFYGDGLRDRLKELNAVGSFQPTTLSEFAAGYSSALRAVQQYGIERVGENASSGIPK